MPASPACQPDSPVKVCQRREWLGIGCGLGGLPGQAGCHHRQPDSPVKVYQRREWLGIGCGLAVCQGKPVASR
ncbi:MAG: hypothetical protein JNK95_04910 [Candidatus Competibacter sp.]|nr:hypothetical protein [Candidatus Competibacter sp.]MDS4059292.1 hypothetical protein [Candidatus Contendobacter sp.]HRD49787.1 hypothetical protein [Candidatus Contendobacter sp.]